MQQKFDMLEIGSYPFVRDGRYGTTLVVRGKDAQRIDEASEELKGLIVALGGEPEEVDPNAP